ncbi:MAG: hypothetical protein KDA91_02810 [Planctomycetaceae bacterium]|nr:hypothetical protein [Planctomycetaceae bacterium]
MDIALFSIGAGQILQRDEEACSGSGHRMQHRVVNSCRTVRKAETYTETGHSEKTITPGCTRFRQAAAKSATLRQISIRRDSFVSALSELQSGKCLLYYALLTNGFPRFFSQPLSAGVVTAAEDGLSELFS